MPRAFKTKMCIIGEVTTLQECRKTHFGESEVSHEWIREAMDLFRRSHRNTAVVPPIREVVVSQPGRKSLYRTVLGFLGSPLLPGEIVWREEITMIWLSMFRPGRASFSAF